MIVGKSVLDYGCGMGDQAIAMKLAGAKMVKGYDPHPKFTAIGAHGVTFTSNVPRAFSAIVLSL